MQLTRRDFIGVGAAAVVLGGLGCAARALPADAQGAPLRPPGGQDEERLLARCLRCDRCRSACPTDCIGTAVLEDGLAQVRTPVMDYRRGGCTFCDRCIDACPTGALLPFDPRAEKIGMAQVVPDVCVAFRSPGSCKICQDKCSFDAVVIIEGHPEVVRDRCNGCGLCVASCWGRSRQDDGSTLHGIEVYTLDTVLPEADDPNAVQPGEEIPDQDGGEGEEAETL